MSDQTASPVPCVKAVQGGRTAFPCALGQPPGHPGPCATPEVPRSMQAREQWEAEQQGYASPPYVPGGSRKDEVDGLAHPRSSTDRDAEFWAIVRPKQSDSPAPPAAVGPFDDKDKALGWVASYSRVPGGVAVKVAQLKGDIYQALGGNEQTADITSVVSPEEGVQFYRDALGDGSPAPSAPVRLDEQRPDYPPGEQTAVPSEARGEPIGFVEQASVEASKPTDRPGDKPRPVPNDEPLAHDVAQQMLEARKQLGTERYGTPLQPFNGRNAYQDVVEEVADALAYVAALGLERAVFAQRVSNALDRETAIQDTELAALLIDLRDWLSA